MIIDPAITSNMPDMGSQNGLQANSGPAASNNVIQKQDPEKTAASSASADPGIRGGLALDDHSGVVVRFYDATGKVVAQFPPEDYIEQMKELNQVIENLFHTTA